MQEERRMGDDFEQTAADQPAVEHNDALLNAVAAQLEVLKHSRAQVDQDHHNAQAVQDDNPFIPPGPSQSYRNDLKPEPYSPEEAREALVKRFLTPRRELDAEWLGQYQHHWPREPNLQSLLWLAPTASSTSLDFVRAGLDGRIVGYREVTRSANALLTGGVGDAKTSTSMLRAPATGSNFVRGKSGHVPFAPGGLEDEVLKHPDEEEEEDGVANGNAAQQGQEEQDGQQKDALSKDVEKLETLLTGERKGLRTVPPGFQRGLGFEGDEDEEDTLLDDDDDPDAAHKLRATAPEYRPLNGFVPKSRAHEDDDENGPAPEGIEADLEELLPKGRAYATHPARSRLHVPVKRDWAHVVDVNQALTNFHELVPDMAHKLDNFQKEAVYHLEQGDSVFVAAHTSAGKTVVAEYAIALAMKHMTRCIYTSPIKALSNQKFRDFKQTFGAQNVGILTGDVQINPEAPCLIMTTEILRSMLYRGADLIRDIEFVIFDEVHYVNDLERGVVWEEVIILCPSHINLILLSATVPNTKEFADWVGRTKKKDIYVISTPKRPVPLEHFLYAGRELFKIVDANGQFLTGGMRDAGEALKRRQDKEREAAGLLPLNHPAARGGAGGGQRGGARGGRGGAAGGANSRGGGRGAMHAARGAIHAAGAGGGGRAGFANSNAGGRGDKQVWVHLIGLLRKKELLPVVTFVFSKKRCEEYASSMPNTDLCTAKEKGEVHIVIEKSLTRLKGTDKKLPQIQRMRELLARGIGVHHGGLLPIVKEVVEILFQRGLVKVLFATETFAMGVNMPARSVIFSNTRKHDGRGFRDLLAGEYTQMAGRAGRRGLDSTGVVIINASDGMPESGPLQTMLLGQPTKLQSQFRLTYNMILNLLRVEALKVEEMIKRSFSENAAQKMLPDQQKKVKEIEKQLSKLSKVADPDWEADLERFHDLCYSADVSNQGMLQIALDQQQGSKNLGPGRVVLLRDHHFDNNGAVIVKQINSRLFLVLAAVTPERKSKAFDLPEGTQTPLWNPNFQGQNLDGLVYDLVEVPLTSIVLVTKHVVKIEPSMILAHRISAMQGAVNALIPYLVEMAEQKTVPEVEWSKLRKLDFQEALRARDGYVSKIAQQVHVMDNENFAKDYALVDKRKRLQREISSLRMSISDQNLELLPDYEQRIEVLKTLRFIDPLNESVLLKGRVACEINSVNELVLTELILNNVFAGYQPDEVVALLSVFVFQEKTEVVPEMNEKLSQGFATILETAERVAGIEAANKVIQPDFSNLLKLGLVEVVYEWARGMSFDKITDLTDVAEGTIVRCITRLDETCREVRDAARVIGDADLFKKMEECQGLIRRDIVFAASLYF
ncbi:Antiviral helicase ski2 [Tilletia horrida]|nr:Antiviral helicase ski2 [Tilletia horrida]